AEGDIDEAVALNRRSVEIARLVVPGAGRIRGVEHGLELGVGHRAHGVEDLRSEIPEGLHETLAGFHGSAMARGNSDDRPAVVPGGDQDAERELVRGTRRLLTKEIDDVTRSTPGIEEEPRQHGLERVEAKLERCDDAE